MRIFRLHRERRKTLTYVWSEFSFRSDEKWAHGSDAKKVISMIFFFSWRRHFLLKQMESLMGLLTLRGPVIKFCMSLCFLGHIGWKRSSVANFLSKNDSKKLNILATGTKYSEKNRAVKTASSTLAKTNHPL